MSQVDPGSPEDVVLEWVGSQVAAMGDRLIALADPVVQHPYFAIAVLVTVVYLVFAARGKKRR